MKFSRILFCLLCLPALLAAQAQFDVLLKGGHVIDPKNNRNGVMDVAIADGKIAEVAPNIAPARAKKVVSVQGLYVLPGFVDIHSHLYAGPEREKHAFGEYSIYPDGFTFRACTTTIADGGSSGWRNFPHFKHAVIDLSKTRVLAFLNIVGNGLSGLKNSQNVDDMDAEASAKMARENRQHIVGFKTVQWQSPEWTPFDRAIEAGKLADMPVMVDFGKFHPQARPYQQLVLEKLRPGDISTHMYKYDVPLFDDNGKLLPYLAQARKRGVKFDLGHGLGNFLFRIVVPAVEQGWWPDSISTDLHRDDMNQAAKDMTNLVSKMLNVGIPLPELVKMTTSQPAAMIKRPELGHLSVGAGADIGVLKLEKGDFGFLDIHLGRISGSQRLSCEVTFRDGKVVWDLNGRTAEDWRKLPKNY